MRTTLIILLILSGHFLFSVTSNPDKPIRGSWDFNQQQAWQIETAGDDILGLVQGIKIAEDGRIFVADRKNARIFIFSPRGRFLAGFGKKGEGPGEIKNYKGGGQLSLVPGSVVFTDRDKVHYFSLDGRYKRSVRILPTLKPREYISENQFISAPEIVIDPKEKAARILVYDIKQKKEQVIAVFNPFEKATDTHSSGDKQVRIGIIITDITPKMLVFYRKNRIYYGMNSSYQLNITNIKGGKLGGLALKGRKPNPVSSQYKKELEQSLGDVPRDMVKNILDGLPPHASFFQQIFVDNNGYIYLFVSAPDSRSSKPVDIFSPEGEYLYSASFTVPGDHSIGRFQLSDGQLLVAVEDEEGNVKLIKYLVDLPK